MRALVPEATFSAVSTYVIQRADSSPLLLHSFSTNSIHTTKMSSRMGLWRRCSKGSCMILPARLLTRSSNIWTLGAWVPRMSDHVMNPRHASRIRTLYTHFCAVTAWLYCFPSSTPFTEPSATIWDSIKISLKPASPNLFPVTYSILQIVWYVPLLNRMFEKRCSFPATSHPLAYKAWSITTTIVSRDSLLLISSDWFNISKTVVKFGPGASMVERYWITSA